MSGFGATIHQTVNEAAVTNDDGEFTNYKDKSQLGKSDQEDVDVEHNILTVKNETYEYGLGLKVKEENNNYIEVPLDQTNQTHFVKCESFDEILTVTNSACEFEFLKATTNCSGSCVDQLNEIKPAKFQSHIEQVNATYKIRKEKRGVKKSVDNTVQRKYYSCEVCNDEFSCKSLYVSHKKKSHGCGYICDVCSKVFTRRDHLERHVACHDAKRTMFACRYCPKELASSYTRKDHERSHTGEKPYVCHICPLAFGNARLLNNHKKQEHSDPFICENCGRSFALRRNLLKHVPVHTREKRWKCGFCDKVFLARYTRNRHVRRFHRDTLPCDSCEMTFGSKGALKKHKWIHMDRPYKCDQCSASFDQNCNLTKHKVLHSALKPHRCDYCDHAYAHGSNLNKHIKAAHPLLSLVAVKNVE